MSAFYHSSGISGVLLSMNCLGGGRGGSQPNKYNIYIIAGMGRRLHARTGPHPPLLPLSLPGAPGKPSPALPRLICQQSDMAPLWTACLSVMLSGSLNHMHLLQPFSIIRRARRVSGRLLGTGERDWVLVTDGVRVEGLPSSAPALLSPWRGAWIGPPATGPRLCSLSRKNTRVLLRVGCSGTVEGGVAGSQASQREAQCWESESALSPSVGTT